MNRERAAKTPSFPSRPAIDLAQIKARYSARPLSGEGEEAGIRFVDAEALSPEELKKELDTQAETDIAGEETRFSGEALSLFDEEDKPGRKRKKKGKKRKKKHPVHSQEDDGLDFVDLAKPRRSPGKTKGGVLEKAVVFSAVVLMGGILLFLYDWLLIDRIEVTGNETLERADALTAAGINVGEHILLVNTGKAQKRLLENPRVKSAQIRRMYPDKLLIHIEERKPLAAIAGGGSYAIIDGEGYVLSIGPDAQDLLEVYGMGYTGFQLGERLGELNSFNSSILLSMIHALERADVAADMARLDITQPLSVNLLTVDGYTIHVGQAENLEEKLANLSPVLKTIKTMGYVGGVIDLAVQGDPVYTPPAAEPEAIEKPEGEPQAPEPAETPTRPEGGEPSPSPGPAQTPAQLPSGGGGNFSG